MNTNDFQDIGSTLESYLKGDCCSKKILLILYKSKKKSDCEIKLYDTICDACIENNNFQLYSLDKILKLNNSDNRKDGIVCRDCVTWGCEKEGCIISLIIDDGQNTRFSKMNRVEIII